VDLIYHLTVISGAIKALIFVAVTAQHDTDEHLHLDSVDQLASTSRSIAIKTLRHRSKITKNV
jgi:hypothetical protein